MWRREKRPHPMTLFAIRCELRADADVYSFYRRYEPFRRGFHPLNQCWRWLVQSDIVTWFYARRGPLGVPGGYGGRFRHC